MRALLQFFVTNNHDNNSADATKVVVRARKKWCTVLARRQLPSLDVAQEMKLCSAAARAAAGLRNKQPKCQKRCRKSASCESKGDVVHFVGTSAAAILGRGSRNESVQRGSARCCRFA